MVTNVRTFWYMRFIYDTYHGVCMSNLTCLIVYIILIYTFQMSVKVENTT